MTAYLSVCAIYRDEAAYLREWIEFHRLAGVERFFLYDNGSVDDHRRILKPYLEQGSVVLHDWPQREGQLPAYEHCLTEHRNDSRWIAFLDCDEFLFSPTGRPVSEFLAEYEQWPAVGVNWAVFGTSGHRTRPPGLVIENYLCRTSDPRSNTHIKSIVDPTRVARCVDPHWFAYESGSAVDENKNPIDDSAFTESVSFSRFRVNHYHMKSEGEYRKKLLAGTADGKPRRPWRGFKKLDARLSQERDETILIYLPQMRKALAGAGKDSL
jgi:hypothetical protein